jgi:hypothetical protein
MLLAQQVIANRIDNAYRHKDKAKQEGNSDYYYWDGYITALESIEGLVLTVQES